MKFSALVVLVMASVALASPAAVRRLLQNDIYKNLVIDCDLQVSLNRSTKIQVDSAGDETLNPCIECPCEPGFNSICHCVSRAIGRVATCCGANDNIDTKRMLLHVKLNKEQREDREPESLLATWPIDMAGDALEWT
jgi:hypothetical protein